MKHGWFSSQVEESLWLTEKAIINCLIKQSRMTLLTGMQDNSLHILKMN